MTVALSAVLLNTDPQREAPAERRGHERTDWTKASDKKIETRPCREGCRFRLGAFP